MNIIKAANLVFDYIRRDEEDKVEEVNRAIDHVDVEIEKGSFVAVLGHNGSGKSTFAKHINGILIPTEGTVWVSEMDTADDDLLWEVRKTRNAFGSFRRISRASSNPFCPAPSSISRK